MSFSPRSLNNPHHNNKNNNNNTNTNNTSNNNKRQLIRPTPLLPWSVDVVSAVPGPVAEILDTALSGATHHKWACLAFPHGIFYVWYIPSPGRNSNSSSSCCVPVGGEKDCRQQQRRLLHRPQEYLKVVLPDFLELEGGGGEEDKPPQHQEQGKGTGAGTGTGRTDTTSETARGLDLPARW
mmetsp:Transcript_23942/g.26724  ORF Transcript_23942/g.26724 Transcript_23942/m.26724 type:complete len:181 (-) Transcript_23942:536-1078(-)